MNDGLPPSYTFSAESFRGLKRMQWSPSGVCLLGGPNGAGKSTVLEVMRFFRNALNRGVLEAVRYSGGAKGLRNAWAEPDDVVVLTVERGRYRWSLSVPVSPDGHTNAYHGEILEVDDEPVLEATLGSDSVMVEGQKRPRSDKVLLDVYGTLHPEDDVNAFIEQIRAIRVYDDFRPFGSRGSPYAEDDQHTYLHPSGRNLAAVLRNWRSAPRRFNGRFKWVLDTVRECFPDLVAELEFTPEGQPVFYPPNAPDPDYDLPLHLAASGLLTGLMQLTAAAGAMDGSLVAFDEMENQLHPHAIRVIIRALRELADERDLTVVLTSHSPVVMNAFKEEPDQFFVLEEGPDGAFPARLDDIEDPDWLAHFSLGDLYERGAFASPGREVG